MTTYIITKYIYEYYEETENCEKDFEKSVITDMKYSIIIHKVNLLISSLIYPVDMRQCQMSSANIIVIHIWFKK